MIARLTDDDPKPPAANVCDRCHMPVHQAAADADPDAARWYHDSIADDVFCGLVMHAADRLGR
jgi:hypothetical protein